MIVKMQRLYSKPGKENKKKGETKKGTEKKETVKPEEAPKEKPAPKTRKPVNKEAEKTGAEKFVIKLKEKGKELMKNPKAKKWGYIGVGAVGGSLAVDGIDAGVKKIKEKKKENEAKEQILKGLKKK